MKILSIGNFEYGWDGSICDELHIANALESMGHEVTRCQRGTLWHLEPPYDFTLVAQYDGYGEELLDNLPKPTVYWAFDYQADGQEWHERLVKGADLYLSKRIADSKYPNWQWLSQDFAPMFLKPSNKAFEKDIEVLFTGSYLDWATERNETLAAVNKKYNLVIHSVNAWPEEFNVKPPIMDHALPELYARAKVILSIDHTLEAGYWSDRNAQILCCGRRPLFRYVPLSESTFHDNVDYFYNIDDCLDKIQDALEYPEQTITQLTQWEYNSVYNRLTVTARVKDLLTIVEAHLADSSIRS